MNPRFLPVLAVPTVLLLLATGCYPDERPGGEIQAGANCCTKAHAVAPIQFSDQSLFQSESRWTTDDDRQIRLSALGGKPQVVAMFFASCQFTCPVIVHNLRRIEAALKPETRARIGFALVSFDSSRDTAEALAAYRQSRALPDSGWTLLRGEPDDVQELAALLGVNFKQDARGDFSHSNQITILDAGGEIVERLVGLNVDVDEAVRRLEAIANPD